ncbi:MAG TPA: Hsp70 family protein, partial [Bacteroidales bacterium]|nr:Hsp70 family protein [Bacteroidales bacterium]
GKEQKIRIEASSGLSDDEIKKMKAEAEANAEADKKAKEEVEKLNTADSLVFNTEKQLKEFGDKVPAEDKAVIEAAAAKLKQAHTDKNFTAIDEATAELNNAWNTASSKMYAQGQPTAGQEQQAQSSDTNNAKQDDGVTDVDFEEVK